MSTEKGIKSSRSITTSPRRIQKSGAPRTNHPREGSLACGAAPARLLRTRQCLRRRQIRTEIAAHTTSAAKSAIAPFDMGRSFHAISAKPTSPMLPMTAPRASRAAASRPRAVFAMPALFFLSRSCFSSRVALAGKSAGKARNKNITTDGGGLAGAVCGRRREGAL